MSKKFYTCLRVAASAKAGRYLFRCAINDEKPRHGLVNYRVSLPLPSQMTAIVKLWRYPCPADYPNYFTASEALHQYRKMACQMALKMLNILTGYREMIAFDLFCSKGHKFECWFQDSPSFEEQNSAGLIHCPICNDNKIGKAFSPFAIKKSGERVREEIDPQKAYQALQIINDYIDKHFEDVGTNFYKEALKIHYGEAEKKNIKGTATTEEEVILKEEGVQFFKVPIIKRLLN